MAWEKSSPVISNQIYLKRYPTADFLLVCRRRLDILTNPLQMSFFLCAVLFFRVSECFPPFFGLDVPIRAWKSSTKIYSPKVAELSNIFLFLFFCKRVVKYCALLFLLPVSKSRGATQHFRFWRNSVRVIVHICKEVLVWMCMSVYLVYIRNCACVYVYSCAFNSVCLYSIILSDGF